MNISLILAHDRKNGIGNDNAMPWAGKIPRDMSRFKKITSGHPIIMGRKTFESIGRPLPNRMNIVLTRDRTWRAKGVWRASSIIDACDIAGKENDELFIIGGEQLFREALPLANRMYITKIDAEFPCDTFFPKYDVKEWIVSCRKSFDKDGSNLFAVDFIDLERIIS